MCLNYFKNLWVYNYKHTNVWFQGHEREIIDHNVTMLSIAELTQKVKDYYGPLDMG